MFTLYDAGKEWEVMAKNLGLGAGRIEALKTRNKPHPDKVKEDMLYTWMKRQPRASDRVSKHWLAGWLTEPILKK